MGGAFGLASFFGLRLVCEGEGLGVRKRVKEAVLMPENCKSFAKRRMAEALPLIAEKFVEEAKKGSIQHAKVLMQLSGLDVKENPKYARTKGKSLAGRLLKALRKRQGERGLKQQHDEQ
jgi:hypothetical protein